MDQKDLKEFNCPENIWVHRKTKRTCQKGSGCVHLSSLLKTIPSISTRYIWEKKFQCEKFVETFSNLRIL